jgi:hypothetical protein
MTLVEGHMNSGPFVRLTQKGDKDDCTQLYNVNNTRALDNVNAVIRMNCQAGTLDGTTTFVQGHSSGSSVIST